MSKALVIPHHHDNLDFLKQWPSFEKDFDVIYIILDKEDSNMLRMTVEWDNIVVVAHNDRKWEFENSYDEWIIPKYDSSNRSLGYYLAWRDGYDLIYTLDNDCGPDIGPDSYWVKEHEANLQLTTNVDWCSTGPITHERTRGLPYSLNTTPVVLSHGLWSNVPDLDAMEQLTNPQVFEPTTTRKTIPKGQFFPMCGMNLAFRREVAPLMYFGLQGPDYPYSRFDDIWAGLFAKKIIDHLGGGVISGIPSVEHQKQSNPFDNLIKEAPGISVNEELWKRISGVHLSKKYNTPVKAYKRLIGMVSFEGLPHPEYWKQLKKATLTWLKLYGE